MFEDLVELVRFVPAIVESRGFPDVSFKIKGILENVGQD